MRLTCHVTGETGLDRDLAADVFIYVDAFKVPGDNRRNAPVDMVGDLRTMEEVLKSSDYPNLRAS